MFNQSYKAIKYVVLSIILTINCYADEANMNNIEEVSSGQSALPEETEAEVKGYLDIDLSIQTAFHDYLSAKGLGNSNDIAIDFTRSSDFNFSAIYKRNSIGAYMKFHTDIENPSLSVNSQSIFNDNYGYNNFNLGTFFMFKDKAGIFMETEINNTGVRLTPKKVITYHDQNLLKNNTYNFNISSKKTVIGVTNFSKEREIFYEALKFALLQDKSQLPIYNEVKSELVDSEYTGYGFLIGMGFGSKAKDLPPSTPFLSNISMTMHMGYTFGNLETSTEKFSLDRITYNSEAEFYLYKGLSTSYVNGSTGLTKRTGLSAFTGAMVGMASGFFAYALLKSPESINKENSYANGNVIPFLNTALNLVASTAISALTNRVISKSRKNSYLADTYYGIKFNYSF